MFRMSPLKQQVTPCTAFIMALSPITAPVMVIVIEGVIAIVIAVVIVLVIVNVSVITQTCHAQMQQQNSTPFAC